MIKNILIITFLMSSFIFANDIVLIGNKNLAISDIETYNIRNIYLKKIKAINDIQLIPIDNKELKKEFDNKVIQRTQRQVSAYWAKMIFSGKNQPPTLLKDDKEVVIAIEQNDEDVLKKIAEDKRVIGYILKKNINQNVKILKEIN
jgi:hypothetical protein